MSSALLYQAFGVRNYRCWRISQSDGVITVHLRPEPSRDRCSACQSANVVRRGAEERTIRTVPIGHKPVEVCLPVPRLGCRDCGAVRQAAIGFASPFRRFTRAFERYALDLLSVMTIQDVAHHLQVGWDSIKDLFKRRLQQQYGRPKLKHVRRIAIDEISIGHGHRYLTVVLDLHSGAVLFIGDGKGADALNPFWKRLKSAREDRSRRHRPVTRLHLRGPRTPAGRPPCLRPLPPDQALQRTPFRLPPRTPPRSRGTAPAGGTQRHPLADSQEPGEPER